MASQVMWRMILIRFEIQRQPQRKPKAEGRHKKTAAEKNKEFIAKVAVCVAIFFVGVLGVIFQPGGNHRNHHEKSLPAISSWSFWNLTTAR